MRTYKSDGGSQWKDGYSVRMQVPQSPKNCQKSVGNLSEICQLQLSVRILSEICQISVKNLTFAIIYGNYVRNDLEFCHETVRTLNSVRKLSIIESGKCQKTVGNFNTNSFLTDFCSCHETLAGNIGIINLSQNCHTTDF